MKPVPDPRDTEAGFSLTEVLGALIILGIAIGAIIAAMGTSIIASDVHRKLVTGDAVIRNYAQALQRPSAFKPCPTPADYAPAAIGYTPPAGATTPPATIKWWDGGNPATFTTATCPAPDDRKGLQLVTIRVVTPGATGQGTITQHLDVVVRRP